MTKIEFEEFSEWTWAIRELPSSVEAVFIDEDVILAGDKEGNIVCWNHEGEVLWKQEVGNRVENFAYTTKSSSANLFLVAGLEVIGLNYSSGDIIWRAALEGISDWVVIDEKNNQVVVTSSVFDLEYYDFIEGCCWRFNFEGELLDSNKMDEKAWHLYSDKDGTMLGLGRPRNGILMLNNDTYEHLDVADSPICCGYENIFGHADGSISILENGGINSHKISDSSINSITIQDERFLISNQDGKIYCNKQNNMQWEYDCNDSLSLINGIKSTEIDLVFTSTRADMGSKIFLLNSNDGNEILTSETNSTIRISASKDNMLLLGMSNGKILIFEMDLLLRRLNQQNDSEGLDEGRKKMLEKLRSLRK